MKANLNSQFAVSYADDHPWKLAMGIRDRIAHGYETLDKQKVWDTAKENIPELLDFCNTYLSERLNSI